MAGISSWLKAILGAAAFALGACETAPEKPAPMGAFMDLAAAIGRTMEAHHYAPNELEQPGYIALRSKVDALAATAANRDAFVSGFNALWRDGPFSHVSLAVAQSNADDTAAYLDTMRVGGDGVAINWRDDVAILTVTTMMGQDTIEQIDAAYREITNRDARALVIDLRRNDGGAFAVRPLVEHTLSHTLPAGVFVSQAWAARHERAPTQADAEGVPAWDGWSITSFWRDATTQMLTPITFRPSAPVYKGPVYVLTSGRTFSAAELAADALKASGRAVLIGETTGGRMLSQKMFDLPHGLQLSLPVADYYAFNTGRIEGAGVIPHIATPADKAFDVALAQIIRPGD